jgi:hypothetical protein
VSGCAGKGGGDGAGLSGAHLPLRDCDSAALVDLHPPLRDSDGTGLSGPHPPGPSGRPLLTSLSQGEESFASGGVEPAIGRRLRAAEVRVYLLRDMWVGGSWISIVLL